MTLIKAPAIVELLALRHSDAVFVPECNLGSAHGGCRRLDAWALLKTWSPMTSIGYEVKVDRQDFLRDRKWVEYLPVCHELYFVSPRGLIAPEELPESVGLLWTTGGTRLITKRRAIRREPDAKALTALMAYVLMSRSRMVADMWEAAKSPEANRDHWRRWLQESKDDKDLGYAVSRRLRKIVEELRDRANRAEYNRSRLEHVEKRLVELGLDAHCEPWALERKLGVERHKRIGDLARQILDLLDNSHGTAT